jgi:hypothetical protein
MSKKVRLTESELVSLISTLINEDYYDGDRLYSRDYIVNRLSRGPRELKKYIKTLPHIPCKNNNTGEDEICTKIPQVIHVYLTGNY